MNRETPICAALVALAASAAASAMAAEKSPKAPIACEAALVSEQAGDRTVQQDYLFKCVGVAPTATQIRFERPTARNDQGLMRAAFVTGRAQAGHQGHR
jgi:hypothetical protein